MMRSTRMKVPKWLHWRQQHQRQQHQQQQHVLVQLSRTSSLSDTSSRFKSNRPRRSSLLQKVSEYLPKMSEGLGSLFRSSSNSSLKDLVSPFAPSDWSNKKLAFSDLKHNAGRIQVLSVDNEPINQRVMQALLWAQEFEVVTLSTGEAALDFINTAPCLPDVVLLDVGLDGMSGFKVCQELRQQYNNCELPIIMTTCSSLEEDVIRGLELGANDYMVKPMRHSELIARIKTQLALKRSVKVAMEASRNLHLLRSILPPNVISQLKRGVTLIAQFHEEVTILFSDIRGFTTLASKWPTEKIIVLLNEMFTTFDQLCDRHGVYKVETIGDAYMIVSGHDGVEDHAERMMRMANDMLDAVEGMVGFDGRPVQIRIGMHTGPAHSGVVGVTRPRYCFFGDTVNTASRMESHGFPMCVHISSCTYDALARQVASGLAAPSNFEFIPCGLRDIKGKGPMLTYISKRGHWQEALGDLMRGQENSQEHYLYSQGPASDCMQSFLHKCSSELGYARNSMSGRASPFTGDQSMVALPQVPELLGVMQPDPPEELMQPPHNPESESSFSLHQTIYGSAIFSPGSPPSTIAPTPQHAMKESAAKPSTAGASSSSREAVSRHAHAADFRRAPSTPAPMLDAEPSGMSVIDNQAFDDRPSTAPAACSASSSLRAMRGSAVAVHARSALPNSSSAALQPFTQAAFAKVSLAHSSPPGSDTHVSLANGLATPANCSDSILEPGSPGGAMRLLHNAGHPGVSLAGRKGQSAPGTVGNGSAAAGPMYSNMACIEEDVANINEAWLSTTMQDAAMSGQVAGSLPVQQKSFWGASMDIPRSGTSMHVWGSNPTGGQTARPSNDRRSWVDAFYKVGHGGWHAPQPAIGIIHSCSGARASIDVPSMGPNYLNHHLVAHDSTDDLQPGPPSFTASAGEATQGVHGVNLQESGSNMAIAQHSAGFAQHSAGFAQHSSGHRSSANQSSWGQNSSMVFSASNMVVDGTAGPSEFDLQVPLTNKFTNSSTVSSMQPLVVKSSIQTSSSATMLLYTTSSEIGSDPGNDQPVTPARNPDASRFGSCAIRDSSRSLSGLPNRSDSARSQLPPSSGATMERLETQILELANNLDDNSLDECIDPAERAKYTPLSPITLPATLNLHGVPSRQASHLQAPSSRPSSRHGNAARSSPAVSCSGRSSPAPGMLTSYSNSNNMAFATMRAHPNHRRAPSSNPSTESLMSSPSVVGRYSPAVPGGSGKLGSFKGGLMNPPKRPPRRYTSEGNMHPAGSHMLHSGAGAAQGDLPPKRLTSASQLVQTGMLGLAGRQDSAADNQGQEAYSARSSRHGGSLPVKAPASDPTRSEQPTQPMAAHASHSVPNIITGALLFTAHQCDSQLQTPNALSSDAASGPAHSGGSSGGSFGRQRLPDPGSTGSNGSLRGRLAPSPRPNGVQRSPAVDSDGSPLAATSQAAGSKVLTSPSKPDGIMKRVKHLFKKTGKSSAD